MSDTLEPPDPELARVFELERTRAGAGEAARARVSMRLLQSLAPAAAPAPTPAPDRGVWRALRGVHPAVTVAVSFAAGLGVGAVLRGPVTAEPARSPSASLSSVPVAAVPSASREPSPPSEPSASPASAEPAPVPVEPAPPPAKAPSASASGKGTSAERVLLDIAYSALGQGQPARALEPLQQHARLFSEGALREEREALAIQCLRDLGRLDEARRRATSFRARYPNSLFAPRLERALGTAQKP